MLTAVASTEADMKYDVESPFEYTRSPASVPAGGGAAGGAGGAGGGGGAAGAVVGSGAVAVTSVDGSERAEGRFSSSPCPVSAAASSSGVGSGVALGGAVREGAAVLVSFAFVAAGCTCTAPA